jgi:myo-inositol-hexaphosphate 3-phosphohydrolase
MTFNVNKCHSIVFGKQKKDDLINHILSGVTLSQVESFKYLGVTLKSNSKWDGRITKIASKASRSLGLLKRVIYRAPMQVKLLAYITLCRSVLDYACTVSIYKKGY